MRTLVGFAIGFRLNAAILPALAAFGLCMLFGVAFQWGFRCMGCSRRTHRPRRACR